MVNSPIWSYQNIHEIRLTTPPLALILFIILDCTPQGAKEIIDQGIILPLRILTGKKINPKYFSWFIKESIASEYLQQISEYKLKLVQWDATAKAEPQKLINTLAIKDGVIIF